MDAGGFKAAGARFGVPPSRLSRSVAALEKEQGLTMVLATLLPIGILFWATAASANVSYWVSAAMVFGTALLLLRAFVLMHECGHGSLFCSDRLNRTFGFVLGVVTGMPQ